MIPCDTAGNHCGFQANDTYLDGQTGQCDDVCVVYRLDNGTENRVPADPRVLCDANNAPDGCLTRAAIDSGMYCSCRCAVDGDTKADDLCTCQHGFACTSFGLSRDSYCVKEAL